MDNYQKYIHISRYARWNVNFERRENWPETVNRLCLCLVKKSGLNPNQQRKMLRDLGFDKERNLADLIRNGIISMDVMPSMRAMSTSGKALEQHQIACYNCAYTEVNTLGTFSEILYILMHGTGIGFSVEKRCVNQLPEVPSVLISQEAAKSNDKIDNKFKYDFVVDDAKYGWKDGFQHIIEGLYSGVIPEWDLSLIRPRGALLKTFGGRASGADPLIKLREEVLKIFMDARGRKLTPRECLDIICHIAKVIIVGGQRRSALLALCDLDDDEIRQAKTGNWWVENSQRSIVNISVVYEKSPTKEQFIKEWNIIHASGCGEPGIFNREAVTKIADKYGRREVNNEIYGCNPCSEILLKNKQFCNLSEVIIRSNDSPETILYKVRIATIIGTLQALFTDFKLIDPLWKKNCDQESLLGVSLTGIMDNLLTSKPSEELKNLLKQMREIAVETNRIVAETIGVKPSVSLSCIKPSGTVSQLVGSSSGIHPRHSKYYIRAVREAKASPIYRMLSDHEVYHESDLMDSDSSEVFYFPIKSPDNCITRHDVGAIELLRLANYYQKYWCEHKISMTVSVKDDEWDEVGDYVFKHFNELAGVTFFPYDSGTYKQAPYTECSKEEYENALRAHPNIDWALLGDYENTDHTTAGHELACKAGGCDL